ncbi:MAG: family 1 glycosylhydrolase [Eubacterium sp.]|nr:family 1 glycosylhydrolase [Eubacterium sp.]
MIKFDKDFLLGASTSSHQVDGNNIHSDYWAMEQMKNSQFVEPSGKAVDHYNRYEEDIKMLADAGLNAYRFSIEWARIEPKKGIFDKKEMQHYKDVIACCKKYNVEPIITLHHFTSPKWLIDMGGWDNEEVVELFADYTKYVVDNIKDDVNYICTINEANMRLQVKSLMKRFMKQMMAKAGGNMPEIPSVEQNDSSNDMEGQVQVGLNLSNPMEKMKLTAIENMQVFGDMNPHTFVSAAGENGDKIVIKAHKASKKVIKSINPKIKVGITLSLHDIQWIDGGEEKAKDSWDEEFGHYIEHICDDDFFGLQNYTRTVYGKDGIVPVENGVQMTQMDYEIYPEALGHVIRRVNKEMPNVPIIVTENGIAIDDDNIRCDFIDKAIKEIQLCKQDGIDILGYCYWSLLDNFEWQKGFALTFGLCEVNHSDFERTPKNSLAHLGSYAG